MGIDAGGLDLRKIAAQENIERLARVLVQDRTTSVSSHFARRSNLSASARERLCEGVKFRWREGFVISAHHLSADHSCVGVEGVSVDVAGELSLLILSLSDARKDAA